MQNCQDFESNQQLLLLQWVTEELRSGLDEDEKNSIRSVAYAQVAIAGLLTHFYPDSQTALPKSEREWLELTQPLLDSLSRDVAAADALARARTTNARNAQMGVEIAEASAVTLGLLVAWLQTKVDLSVKRRDGKTEFQFSVRKSSVQGKTLADIVAVIRELFLSSK